jgi:hypothetical protein
VPSVSPPRRGARRITPRLDLNDFAKGQFRTADREIKSSLRCSRALLIGCFAVFGLSTLSLLALGGSLALEGLGNGKLSFDFLAVVKSLFAVVTGVLARYTYVMSRQLLAHHDNLTQKLVSIERYRAAGLAAAVTGDPDDFAKVLHAHLNQPEIPTMGDGTPMEVARVLLASTKAGRISSPILAGAWDRITHVGKKKEPPANKPIAATALTNPSTDAAGPDDGRTVGTG